MQRALHETSTLPTVGRDERTKLDALTGLRYVAAACILAQHILVSKLEALCESSGNGWQVPHPGHLGMTMFFTLSGFLMVYNYQRAFSSDFRGTLRRFFVARLARIYPVYLFAVVASFSIVGSFFHDLFLRTGETLYCVALQLTLTQSWVYDVVFAEADPRLLSTAYLGLSWSVSVEAFFYLTFPFVCVPIVKRLQSARSVVLAAIGVWALYALGDLSVGLPVRGTDFYQTSDYFHSFIRWLLYISPYGRYGEFLLGCLAAKWFSLTAAHTVSPGETRVAGIVLWSAFAIAGLLAAVPRHMLYDWCFVLNCWKYNVGFAPCCLIVIVCLARYESGLQRVLARPFAVLMGEISYGVYLLHPLVQSWYEYRVQGENDFHHTAIVFFNHLVMLAILHLLCLGSFRYLECPSRLWISQLLTVDRPQAPRIVRVEPSAARSSGIAA